MAQLFSNNATTELSASANATDTVLYVNNTTKFPVLNSGDYFLLTLVEITDGVETGWEIVKATAYDATTVTVERAQENTTARFWPERTKVELRLTAGVVNNFQASLNSTANDLQALEALVYAGL